jgi:chemotaxis signal transduction protein
LNKTLVFCLDKILFGVNINQIKGLSKLGKTKKIPESPEWIGGSAKYRNNTFPFIKLWKILNLEAPKKKVLLLPATLDYCAFLISGVKGIYEFDTDKESSKIYCLPYLSGFGTLQDKTVLQIELDRLLTEKQKKIVKNLSKKIEKK